MLGFVIFLAIIAFFGFLLAKKNAESRPGQKSMNLAVNNAATVWDKAGGQERMMLLARFGLQPGHPLFADTMISKYARLNESVQVSLLGVIEGIRLGVIESTDTDEK